MYKQVMMGLVVALILAMPAAAQPLAPLPPHPVGLAWPTAGWETGEIPEESRETVEALIAEAMSKHPGDVMGETRALVIIHRGRLVAEAYGDGFQPETKQISWSMAKSITQAMVGRAVQLGLIGDIDAPMPSPFAQGDLRRDISWRHWMNAVDGLDYHEIDGDPNPVRNDVVRLMYGPGRMDVVRFIEAQFLPVHPPGTHWSYSTPAFHLIGWALQQLETSYDLRRAELFASMDILPEDIEAAEACRVRMEVDGATTGYPLGCIELLQLDTCRKLQALGDHMPQDCKTISERVHVIRRGWAGDDLLTNLFVNLGMKATIEYDAAGTYLGGSLVWASARDFAKFGYLYLRGGVWDGKQLLPEGWVDFARLPGPAPNTNVYGAGWWIIPPEGPLTHRQNADSEPRDAFHAGGHEGQTIWVVPSRDLVIVRLGLMPNGGGNWPALYEWNQQIARAFPPNR